MNTDPLPGILHTYHSSIPGTLTAFEHLPSSPSSNPPNPTSQTFSSSSSPINTLILIGGLGDGLHTIPFTPLLARSLPSSWHLTEILLSSSYNGWGCSTLDQDVTELSECVAYFQKLRPKGKMVLLGHSTGCQDVMHYLVSEERGERSRPKIHGGILQASVSDREAMQVVMSPEEYTTSYTLAQQMVSSARGMDILPLHLTSKLVPAPISASRWLSLASPGPDHIGQDDYFSSDLSDERIEGSFGKVGGRTGLLGIFYGGKDESVPGDVDKEGLVKRWMEMVVKGGGKVSERSGVVSGGTHNYEGGGQPLDDLIERVRGFLVQIDEEDIRIVTT